MQIYAYAKVNIFLKVTALRGSYHEIVSRFVLSKNLYDVISFEKKQKPSKQFELIGDFGCEIEQNSIYKAYLGLYEFTKSKKVEEFFRNHKIVVKKKIPEFAGLGGGSSNAGAFLNLTNDILKLSLSKSSLTQIGSKIGADIPFFIYGFTSANVSGIGEIVQSFDEEELDFDIITSPVKCSTKEVYEKFRENLKHSSFDILSHNKKETEFLKTKKSKEILKSFKAENLNDLLMPALSLYPALEKYKKEGWFFSGSGSSFFRITRDKG